MKPLKLQLLGPFMLQDDTGTPVVVTSRKAMALLAFLVTRGSRPVNRNELASVFWTRHAEQQALTNLRQTLSVLNRAIGKIQPDWLIRDTGFVAINTDCFAVDIQFLSSREYSSSNYQEQDSWNYSSEFLEGMQFNEPELDDWIASQRRQFQSHAVRVMQQILEQQINDCCFEKAQQLAENLLELDPTDESTHRTLMEIFSALGQRHRILRQYQHCCHLLEANGLGEPCPDTEALFKALYQQTEVRSLFEPRLVETEKPLSENFDSVPAIGVLPFREPKTGLSDYSLGMSLTEEIVNELRQYHGFKVISALSSYTLKDQNYDLATAAKVLGARYLVSGSIRVHNQNLQIAVELVNSINGELIWADRYVRKLEDLFMLQAELARDIAGAIEPEAVGHAYLQSSRKPPSSLSAWDLVLRGDHQLFLQIGTRWNSDNAQNFYQKAIEVSPDYAPAYAGMAYSLCLELKEDIANDRVSIEHRMIDAAQHGANLDPNNPWCLVVLGRALQQLREYDNAIQAYRRAVELCPSSAKAHFGLGFGLSATGEYDDAVEALDRAIELSPRDPLNWSFHTVKALAYLYSEKFELAEKSSRASMNDPRANHWAPAFMAPSLVHLGRYDDALAALNRAKSSKPELSLDIVESAFSVEDDSSAISVREGLIEAGLPKQ